MIAIVNNTYNDTMKKYAWNTNETFSESVQIEFKHEYINRCYLLNGIKE